ncbi:hypothetical protein Q5P01_012311 [Channa striata]|uniref:Uncharacterized protein n=1 Tax=Channa striata TaxID=64152 RepID=A0AA88MNI5_CHASR|nr:hypothetical protein Q5P01_012311 [Channa striata]
MSGSRRLYLPHRTEKHLVDLRRHARELTPRCPPEDVDVSDSSTESSRLYVPEVLDSTAFPQSFHDPGFSRRNYRQHRAFPQSQIKEELYTLGNKLERNQKEEITALDVPEDTNLLPEMKNMGEQVQQLMETVRTLTEEKHSLTAWISSLESQREEQLSVNEALSADVCCLQEVSNLNKKKLEELNNLRTHMQVLQHKVEKAHMLILEKDGLITTQKSQIAYNEQLIEEQYAMINGLRRSICNLEESKVKRKHEKEIQTRTQILRDESGDFSEDKQELDIQNAQKAEDLAKATPVENIGDTTPVTQPKNEHLLEETGNQLEDEKVIGSIKNLREEARISNTQELDPSEQTPLEYKEAKTPTENTQELFIHDDQRATDPCDPTSTEHSDETTPATAPRSKVLLAESKNRSQRYEILTSKENLIAEDKTCTENTEERDPHEATPMEYCGETTSVTTSDRQNPLSETCNQLEDEEAPANMENFKKKSKTPIENTQELFIHDDQRATDPCPPTPIEHSDETTPATAPRSKVLLAESKNHSRRHEILDSKEKLIVDDKGCIEKPEERDIPEQEAENIPEALKLRAKSTLGWISKRLLKLGVCVCTGSLGVAVLAHTLSDVLNFYLCDSLWDYGYQPINPHCNHEKLGIHPF